MTTPRSILHIDMDAFFASVEQLDNPELRGKPVLVGSDKPRGVVCAASYEARPYGCHSAQPMVIAKRNCPHAIVTPVRGHRYREISQQVFDIFKSYTPLVEPLSVDEAFLDITGSTRLYGPPFEIATQIKHRIKSDIHLTASVGLAPNKYLAKIASDLHKPNGLTVVDPDRVQQFLDPLPITRVWGIGPASLRKFENLSVKTIADLRSLSQKQLTRRFGEQGEHFYKLARGIDSRPVVPDSEAKSISQEQTFPVDLADRDAIHEILAAQAEHVAFRLRRHHLFARTVTVKIRHGDFLTNTRSTTFDTSTDRTDLITAAARTLFNTWAEKSFAPVRLIGVGVNQLSDTQQQLSLFADPKEDTQRIVDKITDQIRDKFGRTSIKRGGTIRSDNK